MESKLTLRTDEEMLANIERMGGRMMACRRFGSYVGTTNEELCDVFNGRRMDFYRRQE